jgi:hypothetical protein
MATSVVSRPEISQRPLGSLQKSFRDSLVEARVYCDRDRFIASICHKDVYSLATLYYNGDPYKFFKPPVRGSYNICYFVQFHSLTNKAGDR